MKGLMSKVLIGVFVVSLMAIMPGITLGEEIKEKKVKKKEEVALEEVVVTASRVEEKVSEVPASVQVITSEDIERSNAKNVGDLLAERSCGHIHKYPGQLTSVGIRGFRTNTIGSEIDGRVCVLVNGRRAGTGNLAAIPIEGIERIEIVRGPGSVMYGSAAMGGIINIITKKGKGPFGGEVGYELGSWHYGKSWLESGGELKNLNYHLTVSSSRLLDYDNSGWGKIDNTAYHDETATFRLGYEFQPKNEVSFELSYLHSWDIGSPGARYSPDPDDYVGKLRTSYDIAYQGAKGDIQWQARYYYVDNEETWGDPAMAWGYEKSITDTDTQGTRLQLTLPFLNVHRLTCGFDWDNIETESKMKPAGGPYRPNSEYDNYASFIEDRLSLLGGNLIFTLGGRYDYYDVETKRTSGLSVIPRSESYDDFNARGGFVYKSNQNWRIRGAIGSAFRTPTAYELASDYVFWGTRVVGNPSLDPEESITYEIGTDYIKGGFKAGLTYYYTDYDDKIDQYFDITRGVNTFRNLKGATIQGIEGEFSYDLGEFLKLPYVIRPFLNLTYNTEIEDEESHKDLMYESKLYVKAGFEFSNEKFTSQIIAAYTGKHDVQNWNWLSPTYGQRLEKGGFMVVNFKLTFNLLKELQLRFAIDNLFDRNYSYVRSYPMPERTFTAGLRYKF